MTWGLGSNVLPIILLSVKFLIVLLLEKIEKRIYDYNVVEIPLQNFSVKTFKSSVCKKWSYTSPLKFSSLTNYLPTLESTLWLFTIYKKIPENSLEK